MNEQNISTKPAVWFWIVSGIMLLWNLMGLLAFAMIMSIPTTKESLAAAGFNEAQQDLISSTPSWVNIAFGVAVIFGVLGCIAMLLRKKLAIPLFIISLLGVIAQSTYVFLLSNSVEVMGIGLTPVVIPIAIGLVPLSIFFAKKRWLR